MSKIGTNQMRMVLIKIATISTMERKTVVLLGVAKNA
jgi:hypothetical protein